MLTRGEVIDACMRLPEVYEDYPFHDMNWTVMRHQENRRTFAFIYQKDGRIWINLKSDPLTAAALRERYAAVVPAYHMNKKHWISVILDGSMEDEDILPLLQESYARTAPRLSPRKNTQGGRP